MANIDKGKEFLVSTANIAYYVGGTLAFTGTANLNTSIEVSVEEQDVNAGKGNKLVYSFKYGRQLSSTIETADWKLEYIAANVGSPITEKLTDMYHIAECVDIVGGIGTLASLPVGNVAVELGNGSIITVTPTGSTIDLTDNITEGRVQATYKYNATARIVPIDAESAPMIGTLILDADKHSNKLGKIGSVQIIIPSYQLSGNFNIEFTPDGVTSTNIDGKALAVSGDKCADGSDVYAYIKEIDNTLSAVSVTDIAATPGVLNLSVGESKTLSVIGLKGAMYAPIQIDNADCTFASDAAATATVDASGLVTAVAAGNASISVDYGDHKDIVQVTVA